MAVFVAVDLHLDSKFSDGSETPESIVAEATRIGLSGIALTDHDTLDGIPRAMAAAAAASLRFVPGIELSVDWQAQSMHMLVYFLEPESGPLQDRLEELQQGRARRNDRIIALLRECGLDIDLDEVKEDAGGAVVGRPHFAAVLELYPLRTWPPVDPPTPLASNWRQAKPSPWPGPRARYR